MAGTERKATPDEQAARQRAAEIMERVRDLLEDLDGGEAEEVLQAQRSLAAIHAAVRADEDAETKRGGTALIVCNGQVASMRRQLQRNRRASRELAASDTSDLAVRDALISSLRNAGHSAIQRPIMAAALRIRLGQPEPSDQDVLLNSDRKVVTSVNATLDQFSDGYLRPMLAGLMSAPGVADEARRHFSLVRPDFAARLAQVDDQLLEQAALAAVRGRGRPRGTAALKGAPRSQSELIADVLKAMGVHVSAEAVQKTRKIMGKRKA